MSFSRLRSLNLVLAALLVGLAVHSLKAQTTDAVLGKVKDVLALPDDVAETGTKTVRLRGIVTYVTASRDEFALHDGDA